MSSILKALRRLEEDDPGARPTRPLPEEFIASPGTPLRRDRPRRLARAAAVVALCLALVGAFVWWMSDEDRTAPAVASARASAPRGELASVASPTSTPATTPRPAPARAPVREPAATPPGPPRADPTPTPVRIAEVPTPVRSEPLPTPVRAAPSALPEIEPPAPRAAPAPPPRVSAPPRPAVRREAPRPAPVIPPPPAVTVVKTVWHPSPERRTAEVQVPGGTLPVTVREGETIATLRVATIEPSAVVFNHEGRSLRREVGETR